MLFSQCSKRRKLYCIMGTFRQVLLPPCMVCYTKKHCTITWLRARTRHNFVLSGVGLNRDRGGNQNRFLRSPPPPFFYQRGGLLLPPLGIRESSPLAGGRRGRGEEEEEEPRCGDPREEEMATTIFPENRKKRRGRTELFSFLRTSPPIPSPVTLAKIWKAR